MGINNSSEITSHFESTHFPNTQPRLKTAYEGRLQKHYPKNDTLSVKVPEPEAIFEMT